MTTDKYILNDKGEPVLEPDLMKWADWMEGRAWVVVRQNVGRNFVSTIFLGLDHRFGDNGPPILWETAIFSKPGPGRKLLEMERCSGSREQAEAQHHAVVAKLRQKAKQRC